MDTVLLELVLQLVNINLLPGCSPVEDRVLWAVSYFPVVDIEYLPWRLILRMSFVA